MTKHFRLDPNDVQVSVPADGLAPFQALRRRRGQRAYLSGLGAERSVAGEYDRRGADLLATRWRGQAGEIDLIFLHHGVYVFCEVKKARSFAAAAERIGRRQMQRIGLAAQDYLENSGRSILTNMRFDVALVDAGGGVQLIENAFEAA
ncbi:YraN family protein [Pontibaca methylaminivorans]|uniref:YraN family protein n=1 Tax=Pontibaca methylaminivorans TaxID=515897 RepID=UPI002FD8DB67